MLMGKMKHEFHASFANGLWMFMENSSVCPWLIEKPGFLAMRLDCWDFVPDLQPTQEEGIGQVHVGLHESGRVQSYLKNVYFSVRNLSNKLQEGRQVMASPAK
jgi:hypothetical protein